LWLDLRAKKDISRENPNIAILQISKLVYEIDDAIDCLSLFIAPVIKIKYRKNFGSLIFILC
jgi:hypothetical protein